MPGGRHSLLLQNPGPDWVGISGIDVGADVPVLALIGRRNDHFIEAWVWHRTNLYSLRLSEPVSGTVVLENVPEGSWKVTWWDTEKGVHGESSVVGASGWNTQSPDPAHFAPRRLRPYQEPVELPTSGQSAC